MQGHSSSTPQNRYIPTSEFYSRVIDSLHDYAIITLDMNLIVNSWNAGASKIFGYERNEIIGKHIDVIFTEVDNKNKVPLVEKEKALREGRADDNRWHVRKDHTEFYSFGVAFPIIGENDDLLGFVKILRDLTERKKWKEMIKRYVKELEELNTHKENIMAVLSHDLRNPLTTTIMTSELLKITYDSVSKDEVFNMIDQIYGASINQLKMLDYLLEWARIKYASEGFSPKNIDLENSVNKVLEIFNETVYVNGIELQKEIPENTMVYADEKMLFSILQNLISNAIKYSREEGGIVTISSSSDKDKVIVSIKDNGIGISKEEKEKIFTPQMNLLSTARQDRKGAGIGLLLVKGFVTKNGGEIYVESIKGKGSTFYFTLPAGTT